MWVGESVRKLLVPVDVVFLALVGKQWVLWFQLRMARRLYGTEQYVGSCQ